MCRAIGDRKQVADKRRATDYDSEEFNNGSLGADAEWLDAIQSRRRNWPVKLFLAMAMAEGNAMPKLPEPSSR